MSYPPPPPPPPESPFGAPPGTPPPGTPPAGLPPAGLPPAGLPPAGLPPAGPPPAYQPGVASPVYQQPGYPQAQPGYPQAQPGYPQTAAFPGYSPPPPGKAGGPGGSAALLWGLIALFAVLLCAGAGVAGIIAYQNSSETTAGPATEAPIPGPKVTEVPGPTTGPAQPPTTAPDEGEGVIVYEVTGDGPASIQYTKDGRGGVEQVSDVSLPWRVEVARQQGQFVMNVMASRDSASKGKITCRIEVNGKEVAKQTANGPYVITICLDVSFD